MMATLKIDTIDIDSIKTIRQLLDMLDTLGGRLEGSELYRLAAFNSAYKIITAAIKKSLNEGHFENPMFVEDFTLCFSSYYFQVINDSLAGKDTIPGAWSDLVRPRGRRRLPNFIYLLMGANAHINHDLSLVMVKQLDNDDTDNLFHDIVKVDRILFDSGNKILDSFEETKRLPKIIKNRFKFLYLSPIYAYDSVLESKSLARLYKN